MGDELAGQLALPLRIRRHREVSPGPGLPAGAQALLDDPGYRAFAGAAAIRLAQLRAAGAEPQAVCLAEGLWPGLATWAGLPVIRLGPGGPAWGVLA